MGHTTSQAAQDCVPATRGSRLPGTCRAQQEEGPVRKQQHGRSSRSPIGGLQAMCLVPSQSIRLSALICGSCEAVAQLRDQRRSCCSCHICDSKSRPEFLTDSLVSSSPGTATHLGKLRLLDWPVPEAARCCGAEFQVLT